MSRILDPRILHFRNSGHGHYSKPMSSLELVMAKSSMNTSTKLSILVQEGSRGLRNHSLDPPWETKLRDINKSTIQMLWSRYGYQSKKILAKRILAKYKSKVRNYRELGRPTYRSREERNLLPRKDKTDWFRDNGTTATLSVPSTPGTSLGNIIKKTALDFLVPKEQKSVL